MKSIQVLMSTYNGEKFVREQLESILSQTGVEVHLLVRDDGSKDKTLDILREYKGIDIIEARNIGATNSFFELIKLSGEYDYYAFADQDDVWDLDKLTLAIEQIQDYHCPAIYSSNTRYVDSNLIWIKDENNKPLTTLGSAIVKNYVTGCTAIFNRQLMCELRKHTPNYAPYHDWWINLVCLSIGGVSVHDYKPHINYRQHDNNVVGGNHSFAKKWKSRVYKFRNKQYRRDLMAKEILNNYADNISNQSMSLLNAMTNRKYIKEMTTGNIIDDFLFKICVVFGKV